jgi:hypothetical protein
MSELTSTEGYRSVMPVTLTAEHIDGQGHLNNAAVAVRLTPT